MGDIDHHAEPVHAFDDPRADRAEARRGVTPHGQRPGVPLPRQAGGAERVVTEMHQPDHADATLVPRIDAIDVVDPPRRRLRRRAPPRRRPAPGPAPDPRPTRRREHRLRRLAARSGRAGLDRLPGAPAEVPAGDDRVAHRLGDRRIDPRLPQRVEPVLRRRTDGDAAPHGAERLRDEPRAVGVQIEHERLAMESFRLGVDCRRHGASGLEHDRAFADRRQRHAPSPPSGCSARSACRSRCQIALPSRSISVDA